MAHLLSLTPAMRSARLTSVILPPRGRYYITTTKDNHQPTYNDAIHLLDSLQSNRAIVSDLSNVSSRDTNKNAIPEMLEWTRRAGYEVEDFARKGLRCVHVAGTKGKGSTSYMIENILMQYRSSGHGKRTSSIAAGIGKVGLFTSPHLVTVRERIRIDGHPISEDLFTRYFFELWDRFHTPGKPANDPTARPGYFRYLTILALHAFINEGVQSAIIECGIGGEYDSTNILPANVVTASAITSLAIDHVGMLGNTIEEIAWHKSGIMKEEISTFTVVQDPKAQVVLQSRANEKRARLIVVPRLEASEDSVIKLGLEGDFQKDNASLAVKVAATHLRSLGITVPAELPVEFITGLETVSLLGRCQVVTDGKITWLLDGAHTKSSILASTSWYLEHVAKPLFGSKPPTATMLIFNQEETSSRDAKGLLRALMSTLKSVQDRAYSDHLAHMQRFADKVNLHRREYQQSIDSNSGLVNHQKPIFTYAAFPTNMPFKPTHSALEPSTLPSLQTQEQLAKQYRSDDENIPYEVYPSIEEAVAFARKVSSGDGDRLLVLVTGSLKLVGGVMQVLEKEKKKEKEKSVRDLMKFMFMYDGRVEGEP